MMYCRRCGNQLEEDALFCSKCGTKVEKIKEVKKEFGINKEAIEDIRTKINSNAEKVKTKIEDIGKDKELPIIDAEKKKVIGLIIVLAVVLLVAIIGVNSGSNKQEINSGSNKDKANEEITLDELCEEYEQYVSKNLGDVLTSGALYYLVYVNGDNIPELIIDTKEASKYYEFISYNSGDFITESLWEGAKGTEELGAIGYVEKGNLIQVSTVESSGTCYDKIYKMTESEMVQKHIGCYIIANNEVIRCSWNDQELSVEEYLKTLEKYVGNEVIYLENLSGSVTVEEAFAKIKRSQPIEQTEQDNFVSEELLDSNEGDLKNMPPKKMSSYDEKDVNQSGTIMGFWKYEYDTQGNEIRKIHYDINGFLEWYQDKTYNDSIYTEITYTARGLKEDYREYKMKDNNKDNLLLLKWIYYNDKGKAENIHVLEYDGSDRKVLEITYSYDRTIQSRDVIDYWENGQEKSYIRYNIDGKIVEEYEWDKNGNIIKQKVG